jgi:hypothetical protein
MEQQKYMPKAGLKRPAYVLITTILILSITSSSIARISPLAFKGVTEHFKKGKEFYSPTLGMAALESGLIYNLRFYGNFKAGKDERGRVYHKDISDDPTWNLVKLLFPSNGGTLTVESQHVGNFGRYVNMPKAVALLLNYVYKVRKQNNLSYNATEDLNDILKIVEESIPHTAPTEQKQYDKLIEPVKKTIISLLDYIKKSINEEKKGFYPKYTTEQIILAFFCEKFDSQTDIWQLLKDLDSKEIIDKVPTSNAEALLEPKDIELIIKTPTFNSIDDIYALANADIFERIIPYKAQTTPTSNGSAKAYYRMMNRQTEETFPDCVEVTIRHIFNLMLYNRRDRGFDLSKIKQYLNSKSLLTQELRDNWENLKDFYDNQSTASANSGSFDMRSRWNKIVGDLNGMQQGDKIHYLHKVTNGDYEYELNSGFINIINVFDKALELNLPCIEINKATLNDKISYIEASFKTIFLTINPNQKESYNFEFQALKEGLNTVGAPDVYGRLVVTVKDEQDKDLFSFTMEIAQRHSELKELKVLKLGSLQDKFQQVKLLPRNLKNVLQLDTAHESLLLLLPQQQKLHNLYKLYPKIIEDSDAIIEVLKFISTEIKVQDYYSNILINLLGKVSWDDQETIKKVSPFIKILGTYYKPIQEHVKGLYVGGKSGLTLDNVKEINPQLEYLIVASSGNVTEINLAGLGNLRNLIVSDSRIVAINNLDLCKELEMIDLSDTSKLQEISLSGLTKLKALYLMKSTIGAIHNLYECVSLERVGLSNTEKLKTISLEGLYNLKELDLSASKLEAISNLDECKVLEVLNLSQTQNLQGISLKGLIKLKELYLKESKVVVINKLEECAALEKLSLSDTQLLQEISLKGLIKLKEIYLKKSRIGTINHLNECIVLEKLSLSDTQELHEISLNGLVNLKKLYLKNSKIHTIVSLDECKELEMLELSGTENLKEISLHRLVNLKRLDLSRSGIKTISNLGESKALEVLILSEMQELQEIYLKGLDNLKALVLANSRVSTIHNLNECRALEMLVLSGMQGLRAISLSGLGSLKELDLSNSKVEAINNLDNCKELEILNLSSTENLREAFLRGLIKLKKVSLAKSKVSVIHNLEECVLLEKLNLSYMDNLQAISLHGLTKLKTLRLSGTKLTAISNLEDCESLRNLSLAKARNIRSISLKGLAKLKRLTLSGSKLAVINDFNSCTSLEILDLSKMEDLITISLKGLVNLKGLSLSISGVTTISNLNDCKALEEIDLTNTKLNSNSKKAIKMFQQEHQACTIRT